MSPSGLEHLLIEAVHDEQVVGAAAEHQEQPLAAAVLATCRRIAREVDGESARLRAALAAAGIDADVTAPCPGVQRHAIGVTVKDAESARAAAAKLVDDGCVPWHPLAGGAWESYRRQARRVTLSCPDDPNFVVTIEWSEKSTSMMLPAAFRPSRADWEAVTLPSALWPVYHLVRPVRLVADRVGLRPARPHHLGPLLTTPDSLIGPLIDFAAVSSDDVVLDLGCGDGRLVVEAAVRTGCRARGIESDPHLAELARARVERANASDRVEIVEGDANESGSGDATVVLLFLPGEVVGRVAARIVGRLPPGGRLVAHEQRRILDGPPVDCSALLIGDNALTVAHRWDAAIAD